MGNTLDVRADELRVGDYLTGIYEGYISPIHGVMEGGETVVLLIANPQGGIIEREYPNDKLVEVVTP